MLELKHIAKRLPFGLKIYAPNHTIVLEKDIVCDIGNLYHTQNAIELWNSKYIKCNTLISDIKPILFPLSFLDKEITVNGETFVFTELLEIGDDGGYNYEFDFGNIKIIETLKKVAEHNYHYDMPYLPNQVIEDMIKYHFDTDGLIEQGLAISVFDLPENPYK